MPDSNLDRTQLERPVRGIEFRSRQLVEGFITGLHKSPYHGFSVEFAEHRLYNSGQSTRHVDWKVFARTDKLFTKQYEEETNLRCLLLIDASPSMYYPEKDHGKLDFSLHAAGALAWLLHKQRDAVGVGVFDSELKELTPVKSSRTGLDKLFTVLERYSVTKPAIKGKTNAARVLHEVAEKIHRRSLVVLFTDLFESTADTSEVFKALQHLKHNRHEVLMFHVYDGATELDFNFPDRPHEFIDLESGERLKLKPQEIREGVKQTLDHLHKEITIRCHELKIDLIRSDIRQGFEPVLQAYLIKRGKMN